MAEPKEVVSTESSSPRIANKKDKSKYQAFKSDDEDSSDVDEVDGYLRARPKNKKERSNASSFKVKIINIKGKKKEKEKEKEKKKKTKKVITSGDEGAAEIVEMPLHEPIFGVPIEKAVERSGFPDKIELPRVVRECILYIEENGLEYEGLYRVSGVKSKIDYLKQQYNEGRAVNLESYDSSIVGGLLKLYLRELPSNILTTRLAPIFDAYITKDDPSEQLHKYQQLIHDLPCPNRTLLSWLFTHFAHVLEKTSENKMNIQNLSICFSPTMSVSHGVLNLFFQFTNELFPDVQLVKYVPPEEEDFETVMPDTVESLQTLLQENEEILSKLHDRVNQEDGNNEKLMDDLWEHQRKSTQLKRRIKELRKIEKVKGNQLQISQSGSISESPKLKSSDREVIKKAKVPSNTNKTTTIKEIAKSASKDNESPKQGSPYIRKKRPPPLKKDRESWKAEIVSNKQTATESKEENEHTVNIEKNQVPIKNSESAGDVRESQQLTPSPNKEPATNEKNETREKINFRKDGELKALFLEEQRLIIENEELEAVGVLLRSKLEQEKQQITALKKRLNELNHRSTHSSSSSLVSSHSSSKNSVESLHQDEVEENASEKDILELEILLKDLEEENKKLGNQSEELVRKIITERQLCVQLKTDFKIEELRKASR